MIANIITLLISVALVLVGLWFIFYPKFYQGYYISLYDKNSKFRFIRMLNKFAIRNMEGSWGVIQVRLQGLACIVMGGLVTFIVIVEVVS